MWDAAAASFNEERTGGTAKHVCPNDGRARGESGPTPPLAVKCHAAPRGLCTPKGEGGGAPGAPAGMYDRAVWADNPVWRALGFSMQEPHAYHYNFIWENTGTGYGECSFTVRAVADLDGDDVWSTYELAGLASEKAIDRSAGFYIHQQLE